MRALSLRQASRCETALGDKCRCRCGGQCHGRRRVLEPDPARFEALPDEDPHHVLSAEEKKRRRSKSGRLKMLGQMSLFQEHTDDHAKTPRP